MSYFLLCSQTHLSLFKQNMNILVTGANGQLGNEMRIVSQNTTDHYIFTDVNQVEGLETTYLDITDMDAICKIVKENDVKAIVNCAAWTNVDACETDEKLAALAEKLNAEAPENLAKAMKEVDGLLIQISTDYVFGKEPYNVPCNPNQKGTPTGVYGTTKLHGEQKIMATEFTDLGINFTIFGYSDRPQRYFLTAFQVQQLITR